MPVIIKRKITPTLAKVKDKLHREDVAALKDAQRIAFRAIQARLGGPTTAGSLSRRTSNYASKVQFSQLFVSGGKLAASVHLNRYGGKYDPPYAITHELGMTIRPTNGRYLAIPLRGLRGNTAAAKFSMSPRNYPNGFFFTSRKGNLIFAVKDGKKGRLIPLFVMKTSVKIPRRPVWKLAREDSRGPILARYDLALSRALRGRG